MKNPQFSSEPLYYYVLTNGLVGYAPRNEVAAMKTVSSSRPATAAEAEEWMSFHTFNPILCVA